MMRTRGARYALGPLAFAWDTTPWFSADIWRLHVGGSLYARRKHFSFRRLFAAHGHSGGMWRLKFLWFRLYWFWSEPRTEQAEPAWGGDS